MDAPRETTVRIAIESAAAAVGAAGAAARTPLKAAPEAAGLAGVVAAVDEALREAVAGRYPPRGASNRDEELSGRRLLWPCREGSTLCMQPVVPATSL